LTTVNVVVPITTGLDGGQAEDRLTYSRAVDAKSVFLVAWGVILIAHGIRTMVSPRKALDSNYAWDRRMTRFFTFGKLNPRPRPVTDRAVRFFVVIAVTFASGESWRCSSVSEASFSRSLLAAGKANGLARWRESGGKAA
jgi:hypothetical protein